MNSIKAIKEKLATDREGAFLMLYKKAFPLVARHVSKMGGSFEEAKDVFQDALIIYFEKIQCSDLTLKYSEKAYLFGIARYLWNKRYKAISHHTPLDILCADEEVNVIDLPYQEISESRLLFLLQTAGKKCMELLNAFYYEKLNMETLAKRFGFSNARSVTAQKFKCLEKIKETVKEKSIRYEDIME